MKRLVLCVVVSICVGYSLHAQISGNTDSVIVCPGNELYQSYLDKMEDMVLLKKQSSSFPVVDLETNRIAFIAYNHIDEWTRYIRRYQDLPVIDGNQVQDLIKQSRFDHVIVLCDSLSRVNASVLDSLGDVETSLVLFERPDSLVQLDQTKCADNVLLLPDYSPIARDLSVQAIFGALDINGQLGAVISNKKISGSDYQHISNGRLQYLPPESVGISSLGVQHKVDSIVQQAIHAGAFPGCRILVAIKGKVIFNQAYGHHTYNKRVAVQQHDVYDLASVTKITGPLPLIMKACDSGLIQLDAPFSDYWHDWKRSLFHRSNKDTLTFRQVLAHQARLRSYINYYPMTLKDGRYSSKWYSLLPSDKYSIKIDQNLYLSHTFKKEIYKVIRKSHLRSKAEYTYSGLSYMIYPELLSQLYETSYEKALYDTFYKPLGASSLTYNPLEKISESRIVPTEVDSHFRKRQIKGLVHDEAAAIMGGVSGNAGLFSTADDLAKLMQMYLNKGTYAGRTYISETTFNDFIKVQFPDNNNRRGAGFDKPLFGNDTLSIQDSYPAPAVSPESFGHSGFTGTFVWIDPKCDMVYIFLSNRVYPTRENPLIYQMNVRPSIQQIFYDALEQKP